MKIRYDSLDYLRGVMAVSVMVYHYASWAGLHVDNSSLIGKLGVYAVSIFYILSGLSLSIVYLHRSEFDIIGFWVKRVLRIFPLFIAVVFITLLLKYAKSLYFNTQLDVDFLKIIINVFLVFGFFSPGDYIPIGGWSIGNEMVFYAVFPAIAFFTLKNKSYMFAFFLILSIYMCIYFSLDMMSFNMTLPVLWSNYINPLNQIFLFLLGVAVGYYFKPMVKISNSIVAIIVKIMMVISILVFCMYPINSSEGALLFGPQRLILSLCVFMFVVSIYLLNIKFKGWMHVVLKFTGDCCYSIYLIHPLVSFPVVFALNKIGFGYMISYSMSIIMTLVVSYFSYNYFEMRFSRLPYKSSIREITTIYR
ncbi:acyltransferase family protein [Aeromonas veronii]|uniref:acyltransferase family protein n=1 Tax=Aeromonas veronii TaxID=654 RepID=UPI000CCF700E|nr:acyltransferase [Aeromonas veronii]PNW66355.1 hypothetical protein C2U29_16645 [Aeromonas veronii]